MEPTFKQLKDLAQKIDTGWTDNDKHAIREFLDQAPIYLANPKMLA